MFRVIPRQSPSSPVGTFLSFVKLAVKGELIEGTLSAEFELLFAKEIGVKHAVCFSSARIGLYQLLKVWGVSPGDEVMVPSLTCPIVPGVVVAAGAIPIFIESDPITFNMSYTDIERKLSKRTKVIVATHIEGMPCEIDRICALAAQNHVKVVEDCAQSLGAYYRGRKAGTFGDASYFSFAYGKQINTMGGGMVVTDNDVTARLLRSGTESFAHPSVLRILRKYMLQLAVDAALIRPIFTALVFPTIVLSNLIFKDVIDLLFEDKGEISKLPSYREKYSNFQSWLGIRRLAQLTQNNETRNSYALLYASLIDERINRQKQGEGVRSSYCYFSISHAERKKARNVLLRYGIDTQSSWNRSCADMPEFRSYSAACPIASRLEKEIIYLPIYPRLTEKDVRYVCDVVNRAAI